MTPEVALQEIFEQNEYEQARFDERWASSATYAEKQWEANGRVTYTADQICEKLNTESLR